MFPPDDADNEDPISLKKVCNKEGLWVVINGVLGFDFVQAIPAGILFGLPQAAGHRLITPCNSLFGRIQTRFTFAVISLHCRHCGMQCTSSDSQLKFKYSEKTVARRRGLKLCLYRFFAYFF